MINIAVCDDEIFYLNTVNNILEKNFTDNQLNISSFNCIEDFKKVFDSDSSVFDIIITDIELNDANGIEFAEYIRNKNEKVRIIFISNYINYATEVYNTDHTYFVLKTNAETRLPDAVNKALIQLDKINEEFIAIETLTYETVVIKVSEIIYIERLLRETIIYTLSGKETTHLNIDKINRKINKNTMARIHRSYMINMKHVKRFTGTEITMTNDTVLNVTRSYKKSFKELFMNFIKD